LWSLTARRNFRFRIGFLLVIALLTVLTGRAQDPPRMPGLPGGMDFSQMFDQMFGTPTEEQQQALEKIEISWEDEQRFGREVADRFVAELRGKGVRVVSRGKEVEYLRALLETVRPQMERANRYRRLSVLYADAPDTDARCFPGGTVLVFRGLLETVENEAALVGVLGHELSHIDHGHQLRWLRTFKLAQTSFTPGGGPVNMQDMMANTMMMTQMFARPFRPEDEAQADLDATNWMYRAGYDPQELAKLFLRFEELAKQRGQMSLPFFRTHPYNRDRYEAVLKRFRELTEAEPRADLYVGVRNLWERVPRSKREFEERKR
jgi:predicted Zn-dependent protease